MFGRGTPLPRTIAYHPADMLKLLDKVPANYQMAWVFLVLLWFASAIVMGLAALFIYLEWRVAYFLAFGVLLLLVFCSFACLLWGVVERLHGRVTRWRGQD